MRKTVFSLTVLLFVVGVSLAAVAATGSEESTVEVTDTTPAALAPEVTEPHPQPLSSDECHAVVTCPDGCVIACSGETSCSSTSTSVTCDGRTHTCSDQRICP